MKNIVCKVIKRLILATLIITVFGGGLMFLLKDRAQASESGTWHNLNWHTCFFICPFS